jgi:hypothetical protein
MTLKEVLAMLTMTHATQARRIHFAMPVSVRVTAAWRVRALPTAMGGVSLEGGVRPDVCTTATADVSFPGTRVWSPPT